MDCKKANTFRENRVALSEGKCPGIQLLLKSSPLKWGAQWHYTHLSPKTFLSLQLEIELLNLQ